MDTKTLEALRGSIHKWEKIVAGTGEDLGCKNCPLCQLFHTTSDIDQLCDNCPVFENTKERFCGGSPYIEYADANSKEDKDIAAQAELDFLRSLLPADAA